MRERGFYAARNTPVALRRTNHKCSAVGIYKFSLEAFGVLQAAEAAEPLKAQSGGARSLKPNRATPADGR
jgi:hypothetical protein